MTHIKLRIHSNLREDNDYIYVPYQCITFTRHINEGSVVFVYSLDDCRHVIESPEEIMALIEKANSQCGSGAGNHTDARKRGRTMTRSERIDAAYNWLNANLASVIEDIRRFDSLEEAAEYNYSLYCDQLEAGNVSVELDVDDFISALREVIEREGLVPVDND